jgi:methylamine dehydrogenase heavy chain
MRPTRVRIGLCIASVLSLLAFAARAEVPPESPGRVEKLREPFGAHWIWVGDLVLERISLVDLDAKRYLGMVNGGYGPITPLFPKRRNEMYLPATYYSRRTRGERTDVLVVYDIATLSPLGEIVIPPKRAIDAVPVAHAALTDDERFAGVFNWTPGTSLSIVDVEKREFVGEVAIPGCSLAYAAGARRFLSLCGDGSALVVELDADGHEKSKERTDPFFDPRADPVTEKAVRYRDQWLFVSFDGIVHPVDVSGEKVRFAATWSLLDQRDRGASWRIGGLQHLAVHEKSGRLYSLMHKGGPDTHKEAGTEVWVYDLASKKRTQRIELRNPGVTIYGFPIELGKWTWPFGALSSWLFDTFAPPAVSHIQVTQDEKPLLFTVAQFSGSIGVYDAMDGRFDGRVGPTGWTSDVLLAPWGGGER